MAAILAAAVLFTAGCASPSGNSKNTDEMINALAGVWEDADGDLIWFLPLEQTYVLQKENGRTGRGKFTTSEGYIYFNGFIYDIEMQDDGSFILDRNGSPADDSAESLDGVTFTTSAKTSITEYDNSQIDGTWVDEFGTTVTINTESMEYDLNTESSVSTGTMSDYEDGRGMYLFVDGEAFVILNEDGTLSFDTTDSDLSGSVFNRE